MFRRNEVWIELEQSQVDVFFRPRRHERGMSTTLECPKKLVGRVIGKGGETINAMQKHSGAHIQIDQNVPEGQPCKVHVTGNPQSVAFAQYLLKQVMDGGTGRDQNANLVESAAEQYVAMMKMQQQVAGAWQQPGGSFQAPAAFPAQQFLPAGMPQMYMQPPYGAYPPQFLPQQFPQGFMPQFAAQMQVPQQQQQQQLQQLQQQQQQQQQQPQRAAPQPQSPVAPQNPWTEYQTPEGTPYWYNSLTAQSTWTKPADV